MFTSYLKTIESIVGPYTEEEVYSIYADPNTGKTVLLLGEVFNAISQGQRVVWIDTEGGHEGMFKQFGPSYAKRFGVDINKLEDKYEYIQLLTAQELINYFGVDAEILYDKKISVLMKGFKTKPDGTIYENWGKKKGNLVIIIDSFSSPFRLGFSTKVENFSARADAQGVLVYGLLRFMRQTSAIVIMTHHSSRNPVDVYTQVGKVRGGNTVTYYSKYMLDIEKPKSRALEDYRQIFGVRTARGKSWDLRGWAKINSEGYVDSAQTEVDDIIMKKRKKAIEHLDDGSAGDL